MWSGTGWTQVNGDPRVAVTPLTPPTSVSARTQALLTYLKGLPSKSTGRVISGQFLGNATGNLSAINTINAQSGKMLGLIGGDYWTLTSNPVIDYSFNATAIDYWNKGGLVTLSEHMTNPDTGGSPWDTTINYNALVTPGTPTNTQFMHELDQIAVGLKQLQDAGVVVIYRPFHEMNGQWFWWGFGTDSQFISLWKMEHDYFVNTKGLTNLIWLYGPNAGGSMLGRYPGDNYVDMVGLDVYTDSPGDAVNNYNELVTTGKPFALAEFGACGPECGNPNFNEASLITMFKQQMPKTVLWQQWWERWGIDQNQNVSGALNDSWVLNRGDINYSGTVTPTPAPTPNAGTVSANDATATLGSGTIKDSQLNAWTISSAGVVLENGTNAALSANVNLLLWHSNVIYQRNTVGNWWMWNGSGWVTVSGDPRVSTTPTATPVPAGVVKIMPLGDSITAISSGGEYRTPLWNLFKADGIGIDFVGSQQSSVDGTLPDPDNEGHGGWTSVQLKQGVDSNSWMETYRPDVVLLLVGTNDIGLGSSLSQTSTNISALIDDTLTRLPNTRIIVSNLLARADDGSGWVNQFNAQFQPVIQSKGSRVTFVNMHDALTLNDLVDGLHPNATGYSKMAHLWETSVRSVLGR